MNKIYSIFSDESGTLVKYRIDYQAERSIRRKLRGKYKATEISRKSYSIGDHYYLEFSDYHSSEIYSASEVITLVLAKHVRNATAYVLSNGNEATEFPNDYLSGNSADKIRNRIRTLLLQS